MLPAHLIPRQLSGRALRSPVIRSVFNTDPVQAMIADDAAATFRAASVTHVEFQVFGRPWQTESEWESTVGMRLDWCAANGFRVMATADHTFSIPGERQTESTVRRVARRLRDSGIVDGVEMVDEARSPAEYQPQDFWRWWNEESGPPIAWPCVNPHVWNSYQHYTSYYWPAWSSDPTIRLRPYDLIARGAGMARPDRHWVCLGWCCGPQYKNGLPSITGVSTRQIMAQAWAALAHGASGIRYYGYDWPLWRESRALDLPGVLQQTGARTGDERWPGIIRAYQSIRRWEPELAGPHYAPLQRTNWLIGRRGRLVWGVNVSNTARPNPASGNTVPPNGVAFWRLP